jgi:hypothetical protein
VPQGAPGPTHVFVRVTSGLPKAFKAGVPHEEFESTTVGDHVGTPGAVPTVPTERGTPRGSPLSPLLLTLFAVPLVERLRARSTGVELCANNDFTRCLLFADDTCLVASSLSDPQRVLDVCSQRAAETATVFNARKSHLLHLCVGT